MYSVCARQSPHYHLPHCVIHAAFHRKICYFLWPLHCSGKVRISPFLFFFFFWRPSSILLGLRKSHGTLEKEREEGCVCEQKSALLRLVRLWRFFEVWFGTISLLFKGFSWGRETEGLPALNQLGEEEEEEEKAKLYKEKATVYFWKTRCLNFISITSLLSKHTFSGKRHAESRVAFAFCVQARRGRTKRRKRGKRKK